MRTPKIKARETQTTNNLPKEPKTTKPDNNLRKAPTDTPIINLHIIICPKVNKNSIITVGKPKIKELDKKAKAYLNLAPKKPKRAITTERSQT